MKKQIIRYILLIFIIILLFTCTSTINEELKIGKVDRNVSIIDDSTTDYLLYHIYFEHTGNKDYSFGMNCNDASGDLNVSLYPGEYNIYGYGLIDKTPTSKKVFSYCISNYNIFDNNQITLLFKTLIPQAEVYIDETSYQPILKIYMNELSQIFSISSLSVKQGTDRVRSVDYTFDKNSNAYIAYLTVYQNGNWYMNISFSLKSKKDDDVLERDNISISTSNFSNIYLGEFIF